MFEVLELIHTAGFTAEEEDAACYGLCGTFALALHKVLNARGIENQLIVFVERLDEEEWWWHHVAVKVDHNIFDITGRINEVRTNEHYDTTGYHVTDRRKVLELMRRAELECRKYGEYDLTDPQNFSARMLREYVARLNGKVTIALPDSMKQYA